MPLRDVLDILLGVFGCGVAVGVVICMLAWGWEL